MKNDGTHSQNLFTSALKHAGKKVHFHRLTDTRELRRGPGMKTPNVSAPADYTISFLEMTGLPLIFAEVKSFTKSHLFSFNAITKSQWITAKAMSIAGTGNAYRFYCHRLDIDNWYEIDADLIAFFDSKGVRSMRLDDSYRATKLEALITKFRGETQ